MFSSSEPGSLQLAFRVPGGGRAAYSFKDSTTLQVCGLGSYMYLAVDMRFYVQDLYGYVFACIGVDVPFCLYLAFPRKKIPPSAQTMDEFGLMSGEVLTIETDSQSSDFNPLILFASYLPQDSLAAKVGFPTSVYGICIL